MKDYQDPPSTLKRDLYRSFLEVVGLYRGHLGGLGSAQDLGCRVMD